MDPSEAAPNSALIERHNSEVVAVVNHSEISALAFKLQIAALSESLPKRPYAINLCQQRIHFQRSMLAVIAAGQCNLLPPNKQFATVEKLIQKYPDSYVISDTKPTDAYSVPHVNVEKLTELVEPSAVDPHTNSAPKQLINDDQLAAISFTSGSTGESLPNIKTWAMLREGNAINIENMLDSATEKVNLLATVPPQHMYGLELSVLLPLSANVSVFNGQPLFPADVLEALEAMPSPRVLVSTPQHLRALTRSKLKFPPVARIFSATAPLDIELAKLTESMFQGTLVEIYGCSEVGSIARRKSVQEQHWTPFSAMQLSIKPNGAFIYAKHVGTEIALQDIIQQETNSTFSLQGRLADLVNIAGKRGSLAHINKQLLSIESLSDGIVFNPENNNDQTDSGRLAAIVVADASSKKHIIDSLKRQLDSVFIPRPILFTDTLPRNETGKITRKDLLALFDTLKTKAAQ